MIVNLADHSDLCWSMPNHRTSTRSPGLEPK